MAIYKFNPDKFGADLEHIINLAEVKRILCICNQLIFNFWQELGSIVMSFYKILAKTFLQFTVVAITACTASPPISQTPAVAPKLTLAQKLQNTLDSKRKSSDLKGVSAAIIMPNEEIWLGVSGMSDPTIDEQINPEMLFDIGSTGKNYVAALVLQLVEEGRLTLEDPLRKWLPDYPNIDNNITVRQMLNHTSGIYDFVKHARSPWQMAYKSTKM